MKTSLAKFGVLLVALLWMGVVQSAHAGGPPVAMLTQTKGDVKVSKDGKKWKKVRRNKFLFAGYQVKTGADGTGKLVNQATSMTREIGANSIVKITKKDAEAVSGTLSAAKQDSGNLVSGLGKRFSKAQRYTTVRRSVEKKKKLKLATVSKITLSDTYPDLVWSGLGKEYSYTLLIDGKSTHDVPATSGSMVRFTVPKLSPGIHKYQVLVLKDGKQVYPTEKDAKKAAQKAGKITWLSKDEEGQILGTLAKIEESSPGDALLKAIFMEEKALHVSAMDLYTTYFDANADDTDMYPMLIKAYHDLKLMEMKKAGALKLQDMIKAEEEEG